MDKIFDEFMEEFDRLGQSFFKNIKAFKDLEKDPRNLQLGGPADAALAEAMKYQMNFLGLLEDVKRLKMPFFGGAHHKKLKREMIEHSSTNLWQMNRAMNGIDKTFTDGAFTKVFIDYARTAMK